MIKEKEYQITLTKPDIEFLLELLAIIEDGFTQKTNFFEVNYDFTATSNRLISQTHDDYTGKWL